MDDGMAARAVASSNDDEVSQRDRRDGPSGEQREIDIERQDQAVDLSWAAVPLVRAVVPSIGPVAEAPIFTAPTALAIDPDSAAVAPAVRAAGPRPPWWDDVARPAWDGRR